MFAACTYEEIEARERLIENKEIVVFLFVKPTDSAVLQEFEYIHYNSAKYCSVYAIGYTDDSNIANNPPFRKVDCHMTNDWYYSAKAFVDFKDKLQKRIKKWRYSGETEILVLQNNPGARQILDFTNYVSIDVNKGIKEGYLDSFQRFMESLIRSSKKEVTAKDAIKDIRKSKISIKGVLTTAIDECKEVPIPVKKILKNRLFYRCSNSKL